MGVVLVVAVWAHQLGLIWRRDQGNVNHVPYEDIRM